MGAYRGIGRTIMRLAINIFWAIMSLAFAFVILMFVWDNQTQVSLRLLAWQTPQRAVADYLIFAFALGLVPSLIALLGIFVSHRLQMQSGERREQAGERLQPAADDGDGDDLL